MKKTPLFSLFSLFSFLTLGLSPLFSETIPQRYPLNRYQHLSKNLPFGKPTVIETEAPKPPPFTEDFTLLGFSKVGTGYFVSLANKKTQQKIFLSPKDKPDGITVIEVMNHSEMNKIEIKLKKGSEIGSIKFDPNYLSAPNMGNPMIGMPVSQMPNFNPPPNNGSPQNKFPTQGGNLPPLPPNFTPPPQTNPHATNPNIIPPQTPPLSGTPQDPQNSPVPNGRIRRVIVPTQSP